MIDKIDILGQEFDVQEFTDEHDIDSNLYGMCVYATNEIKIRKELKPKQKGMVFLHEILHAIDYLQELRLKEREIQQLAVALYPIIKSAEIFNDIGVDSIP